TSGTKHSPTTFSNLRLPPTSMTLALFQHFQFTSVSLNIHWRNDMRRRFQLGLLCHCLAYYTRLNPFCRDHEKWLP
ncbi:hypothetical protein VIGAN_04220500, partial [Vigna angularis var. angularis]